MVAAEKWGVCVASHTFTDRASQMAIRAGVKTTEDGFLLHVETLKMMAKKGVPLSGRQLLNDEDAFSFADPVNTVKGTDYEKRSQCHEQ